jgi:glyoxylase-like metal-dependent hydrolase (beta-lactamase superfamily II)
VIRLSRGDLQLTVLDGGRLRLDGGAMFGVVPKPLWERERIPDARNRIGLAMNVLLVQDGRRNLLVDTGAGPAWDDKAKDIYAIEGKTAAELLAPAGLAPEQVDVVLDTHLHFDHAGGNTERDARGELRAAFPNAEYLVQKGDLEVAGWQNERTRASYLPQAFEPLLREGRLRTIEGEADLGGGLRVVLAPGHTPWLQLPLLTTAEGTVLFLSDLVPTASHLRYPWIMGYDLEPLRTLESKKRLLPKAAREGWWLVFEHDPDLPVATLEEKAGKLVARRPFQLEQEA